MAILQGILVLGLIIGFFVGVGYLLDKFLDLILDKKGDKLETITTIDGGKWLIAQLCSVIRNMCDSVQDDNNFASYPSKYIAWKSDILNYNIGNILGYIKQKRQQFPPIAYELILQTFKPLEHITSLDENIIYRIIVLKKDKKEDKAMSKKQLSLDDKEMLRFVERYIAHHIDYSEVGCNCENYTDKVYEVEYQMDFQDLKSKKIANILFDLRRGFEQDKYCIIMQLSKPLFDIYKKDDYITIKLIVVDQKYNRLVEALKEVLNPTDEKQKILNDIEEAQRKLGEARKKLDEYNEGYKRFRPKDGKIYYFVDSDGDVLNVYFDGSSDYDVSRYNTFNCFRTFGEAEAEAEKILVRRMLEDITRRLNKGKEIDWDNRNQNKWFIAYEGSLTTYPSSIVKHQGTVYCLYKNFLDVAKREIGEDRLIKYLKGEG